MFHRPSAAKPLSTLESIMLSPTATRDAIEYNQIRTYSAQQWRDWQHHLFWFSDDQLSGEPDARTIDAIVLFQRRVRQTEDGKVGPKTLPYLEEQLALAKTCTHGIDVSKWQGEIDFDQMMDHPRAHDRVGFLYARAQIGTAADKRFPEYWRAARRHAIARAPYSFPYFGRDVDKQVSRLLKTLEKAGGYESDDLPCMVDIEKARNAPRQIKTDTDAREYLEFMERYCLLIEHDLHKPVVIYVNPYWWDGDMRNPPKTWLYERCLWNSGYLPLQNLKMPGQWATRRLWQYTETGTLPGVSENTVDFNWLWGGLGALQRMCLP